MYGHTETGEYWLGRRQLPTTIAFSASDHQPPPPPHRPELRALFCEITVISGPGEYVEWVQDQFVDTQLLTEGGSSSQVLSITLMSAIVVH